jgi:hypothetical protein
VTVADWLRERVPRPPARLTTSIEAALGDRVTAPDDATGAVCLDAAESLLRDLLARASAGRESALDLLTVDALITYAFEAAAENPDTFDARARRAAWRLADTVGNE